MSFEIRALRTPAEVDEGFRVFLRAMVGLPFSEVDAVALTDPGRYLGAFEGERIVGGVDSYASWLVVPGGARVAHAAVTHIGVLPTHRRRGIVSALVRRQLEEAAERGEVVATLRASEATIYERFGYAVASSARSVSVTRRRARLREHPERTAAGGGEIRLADGAGAFDLLAAIYARVATWNGAIARPEGWWALRRLLAHDDPRPLYVVVHSTAGIDDGFVVYRPENTAAWFTSPEKTVRVSEFVAADDHVRRALLRHLFELDLVDVVAFDALALDDPLPAGVVDRRAVVLGPESDETWLRLLDVEAALRARRFAAAEPVVIGVRDALLPANTGSYRIGADGVARSDARPEIEVDVTALAAAYLGGTRWWQLAAAGLLAPGHTSDAVVRLDALFATPRLPFAGTTF